MTLTKRCLRILFAFTLLMHTLQCMSSNTNPWRKFISLSAELSRACPGQQQSIYLSPDIVKTYNPDKNSITLPGAELFFGAQYLLGNYITTQTGLVLGVSNSPQLTGEIWEDANPEFNNYIYSYKVFHSFIGLKTKLLIDIDKTFQPYISGSVGLGYNRAYDFNIMPKIFEEVPAPEFTSHTTKTFSYTIGTGLEFKLKKHWSVGLGYNFSDWGKSKFELAPGQILNCGLELSHFNNHKVHFSFTYIS